MTKLLLLIHLRNQYTPTPLCIGDPNVIALCDEIERLESAIAGTGDTAILTVNVLRWPAEERIAFARHLLGAEWRAPEHERLEGMLRALGNAEIARRKVVEENVWKDRSEYFRAVDDAIHAVCDEAVRLAKEKP